MGGGADACAQIAACRRGMNAALQYVDHLRDVLALGMMNSGDWPIQREGFDCTACAQQIQLRIGGDIVRITPTEGQSLGPSKNNPQGSWVYHDAVVQKGKVYDSYTGPNGLTPDEYMAQWEYAEAIDFGAISEDG
jgi:hypothetical protein